MGEGAGTAGRTYSLEYGIFVRRRLDVFDLLVFGLALGLRVRLGRFDLGFGRRVCRNRDFGFGRGQRHFTLTTVAAALAAVTTVIAAGVFGAKRTDFARWLATDAACEDCCFRRHLRTAL